MRIVVAPDSFKECLPSHAVGLAIARGILRADPTASIAAVPIADGGQGTVEALVRATNGRFATETVTGPLGAPTVARFGWLGTTDSPTAVIEMAAAAGLELVPPNQRDPRLATTFGVGELVRRAVDAGAQKILLGIGGSATNDGGAGFAQALGYQLLDDWDRPIGRGGSELARLKSIRSTEVSPLLKTIPIVIACDVTNPLTGPKGASAIFGPQKGASPSVVEELDANLRHFAAVIRRDLGRDVETTPGAGAAGGLGAGLLAFTNATLQRGVDVVLDAVQFDQLVAGADLCITGEGAIDPSTAFGKTAVGVAKRCQQVGVPTIALAGALRPGCDLLISSTDLKAIFSITQYPCELSLALANAETWLADTAEQVIRAFQLGVERRHTRRG